MVDLGRTTSEFLTATPRQFRWLMDRKIIEWQREDYRAGIVGTMVANFSGFRDKDAKVFEPADLFSSLPRWGKKRSDGVTSDAQNKAVLKMLAMRQKAVGAKRGPQASPTE